MSRYMSVNQVLLFLLTLTLPLRTAAGYPAGKALQVKPICIGTPSNATEEFDCLLANHIFGQIGIQIQANPNAFIRQLDLREDQSTPYFSRKDMLAILDAYAFETSDSDVVPVFYIDGIEGNLSGISYPPTLAATLGTHPGIFISLGHHYPDTFANEIGHFLLDDWRFVDDPNDPNHISDPNALMASDAIRNIPATTDDAAPNGDLSKIDFSWVESVDTPENLGRISQFEAISSSSSLITSIPYYDDFHLASSITTMENGLPGKRNLNDTLGDCDLEWGVRTPVALVEERVDFAGQVTTRKSYVSVSAWPRFVRDPSGQDYLEVQYDIVFDEPYHFAAEATSAAIPNPLGVETRPNLAISTYLQGWLLNGVESLGSPATVDLRVSVDVNMEQPLEVSHNLVAWEPTWFRDDDGQVKAMPLMLQLLNEDLQGARRIVWRYRVPISYEVDPVIKVDPPIIVPGDANRDGTVNEADLDILLRNFGKAGNWQQGDFDGDGLVGEADLVWLLYNWQGDPINWEDYEEYKYLLGSV